MTKPVGEFNYDVYRNDISRLSNEVKHSLSTVLQLQNTVSNSQNRHE